MNARFNLLRKLVATELPHLLQVQQCGGSVGQSVDGWLTRLPMLREEIIDGIAELVLSDERTKLIVRQLQQVQVSCTSLLDLLKGNHIKQDDMVWPLAEEVRNCLKAIMTYLRDHHYQYFNWRAQVSGYDIEELVAELAAKKTLLGACLKKWAIDENLQTIIYGAFDISKFHGCLSSIQIRNIRHMHQMIVQLPIRYRQPDADGALLKHLVGLGFNCEALIAHYQQRISDEINNAHLVENKLELLCSYEKQFILQQQTCNCQYLENVAMASDTMLAFINVEVKYVQKNHYSRNQQDETRPPGNTGYRVKTLLSVDSLAFLVRLMIDTAMIEANPRSSFIAFIAANFQTTRNKNASLSVNSLNTKYKQVTQSTAQRVRIMLQEMIMHIDAKWI